MKLFADYHPTDPLSRPVPLWMGELSREIFVEPGGRVHNLLPAGGLDWPCCSYPGDAR